MKEYIVLPNKIDRYQTQQETKGEQDSLMRDIGSVDSIAPPGSTSIMPD